MFRAASLEHVNKILREQLDQTTASNQQLTADTHRLSQDCQRLRGELETREREWRDEEQVRTPKVVVSFFLLCIFLGI